MGGQGFAVGCLFSRGKFLLGSLFFATKVDKGKSMVKIIEQMGGKTFRSKFYPPKGKTVLKPLLPFLKWLVYYNSDFSYLFFFFPNLPGKGLGGARGRNWQKRPIVYRGLHCRGYTGDLKNIF